MSYNEDTTPAVCEKCLGDSPYIEMTRQRNGAQCKICTRPFTVFSWAQHGGKVFKKTVICLTCARARNCCQCCMLDLSLGIDLNTRDQLLKMAGATEEDIHPDDVVRGAKNEVSRIYNANQMDRKFAKEDARGGIPANNSERAKKLLEKITILTRSRGKKSSKASKRIENKSKATPINPSIKLSRAKLVKLCRGLPFNGNLSCPPKNNAIKQFFIFGNNDRIANYDVEEYFNDLSHQDGTIKAPKLIEAMILNSRGRFGFIQFVSRDVAESIARIVCEDAKYKKPYSVQIHNIPMRICWASKVDNGTSNYNNIDLDNIANVVRLQMVKLAKLDGKHKTESKSSGKISTKMDESKPRQYTALRTDFEL